MAARLPGPRGLEEMRYAMVSFRDPYGTIVDLTRKFGRVFVFGRGRFRFVFLMGPEANQYVLFDHPERFRSRDAFDLLAPVDGKTGLLVSDGEEHRRRRHLVQPAFGRVRLESYVAIMSAFAKQTLEQLPDGGVVDIYQAFRKAIARTVIRCLFGESTMPHADTLRAHLDLIAGYIQRNQVLQVPLPIPGTAYSKVLRAQRAIDAIVHREIAERKRAPGESDDLLGLLVCSRDEEGEGLSDTEIRDQIVSLIAAGYDTTGAALGWTLYFMLLEPEHWERARSECLAALGEAPITAGSLPRLPRLDWLLSESLRLRPPGYLGARRANVAFEFGGFNVPKDSRVLYSPYVTHRLPDIWEDPERFRPERWDPASPSYRHPSPAEYLPFGGGAHRCIGASFALIQMKVILAEFLRASRLSLVDPQDVRPVGFTFMNPNRVMVRVNKQSIEPSQQGFNRRHASTSSALLSGGNTG